MLPGRAGFGGQAFQSKLCTLGSQAIELVSSLPGTELALLTRKTTTPTISDDKRVTNFNRGQGVPNAVEPKDT